MVDMRQEQQQPGLEIAKQVFFDRRALDAIAQWQADDGGEPVRAKLLNRGGIGTEIRAPRPGRERRRPAASGQQATGRGSSPTAARTRSPLNWNDVSAETI